MVNWEYKWYQKRGEHTPTFLNESGKEGWELVSVTQVEKSYTYFMKRRVYDRHEVTLEDMFRQEGLIHD